jgi:PA14 domain
MVGLVGVGIMGSVSVLKDRVGNNLTMAGNCVSTPWRAEFWNNASFSGPAVLTRAECGPPKYNWAAGSPAPAVNGDSFSSRFTGTVNLTAGSHTFSTYHDDQMRIFVDGVLITPGWVNMYTWSGTITTTAGFHDVVVEQFEGVGAADINLTIT